MKVMVVAILKSQLSDTPPNAPTAPGFTLYDEDIYPVPKITGWSGMPKSTVYCIKKTT